jgi:hypothetical protein
MYKKKVYKQPYYSVKDLTTPTTYIHNASTKIAVITSNGDKPAKDVSDFL